MKTQFSMFPKVFVDTSFWIASLNSEDKNHSVAKHWLKQIKDNPVILVTSNYVIVETLTLLICSSAFSRRDLQQRKALARKFYNSWFRMPLLLRELIYVDKDIWEKSSELFFKYTDKDFSFTDCTSFCLMDKLGIFQAATFDHHFSQAGKVIVTHSYT